jgi:hypothetical protein
LDYFFNGLGPVFVDGLEMPSIGTGAVHRHSAAKPVKSSRIPPFFKFVLNGTQVLKG